MGLNQQAVNGNVSITGKNYYVDGDGTNGIGSGTCDSSVCIRAGAAGNTDAQRRAWLQAQDESAVAMFPTDNVGTNHDNNPTTPNLTWEAWDSSLWGSFTTAGSYPLLTWNTTHWQDAGVRGKAPLLKYGDNPHTADDPDTDADENVDECALLPGYGNTDAGKARCGDLLPHQALYRARGNVVFSGVTIGAPTSSSGPEFFYSVGGTSGSDSSVTVTYNLPTGISISASGVEQADGTASSDVTWAQGTSAGSIGGIASGETFWLALTFQKGSGTSAVTHKVRIKFVRP